MKAMLYILLSVTLLASACKKEDESCHKTIKIVNQSDKSIYVECTYGHPDTAYFVYEPNPALSPEMYKVSSGETNSRALWSRNCWETNFEVYLPSDTLMIYVFDAQVLETTPWDTVKANYLVLKRYDLSLQDLEKMDWTITYP